MRIVTGFVEPHFFAGFSGGPKGVCPGLAATETILEAHHPRRIADARATFVTRAGNPVHDFVRAAAALAPPAPVARRGHQPGPPGDRRLRRPAARRARRRVRTRGSSAVRGVGAPFDVVVSTNGGYPLDRNLYQAVKGMAAAERIVRDGGIIVMAAACEDGVPAGGAFARLLGAATTPANSPGPPAAPSSTAGRPRYSAGSSPGPRCSSQRGPRPGRDRGRTARAGPRSRRRGGRRIGPPRSGGAGGRDPRGPAHGGDGRPRDP